MKPATDGNHAGQETMAAQQLTTEYFACHRGADKNGALGEQWFLIEEEPLSLEGAKEACQQLFDSGILYHPSLSEFRICLANGAPIHESKPPHGAALLWQLSTR